MGKSLKALQLETRGHAIALCQHAGIERVGFVDITLKEHVGRLDAFWPKAIGLINLIRARYDRFVLVASKSERSGRYHAHGLVSMREDIKTGFPWSDWDARDYRRIPKYLRGEWEWLREAAALTGAGRVSIMPVRTDTEKVCFYMCRPQEFRGAVVQFGRELKL